MELKEGMYVRFDKVFCRVDEIENGRVSFDRDFYDHWAELTMSLPIDIFLEEYKPKISYNPLDLLEVEDVLEFDVTDEDNYADILGINVWKIESKEELAGVKEMIEMGSATLLRILLHQIYYSDSYALEVKYE